MRKTDALRKARRWLCALDLPPDDTERNVLRIFGLSAARASAGELCDCARKLRPFTWFNYTADPVPALLAHRALVSAGCTISSLENLAQGYRSLLPAAEEPPLPLLCELLSIPSTAQPQVQLPSIAQMIEATRVEVMEVCRIVTMVTSRGTRPIDAGESAVLFPALAASYARDWDIETCASLLRVSAYLNLTGAPDCQWSIEWLLDQQQSDGRFGLLNSEAARCGWDERDWRLWFDRTIHAVWALGETTQRAGMRNVKRVSSGAD